MKRLFFLLVGLALWMPAVMLGEKVHGFIVEPNVVWGVILPSILGLYFFLMSSIIIGIFVGVAMEDQLAYEDPEPSVGSAILMLHSAALFGTVAAPQSTYGSFGNWFGSPLMVIALIGLVPALYVIVMNTFDFVRNVEIVR